MLLGKKRKLGRLIEEIQVGEKLRFSEKIEDKDLLLYLGLTDDNNPLYIQHDYASLTPYEKPIVPPVMLMGMITGAVSKIMPGPGSSIISQTLAFPEPVYHYSDVHFLMTVEGVDRTKQIITIKVEAEDGQGIKVIEGHVEVKPPFPPKAVHSATFDNF